VSDDTWAALSTRWSDAELVELLVVAGFYRLVSGFLNSAGVELDPGVPGFPDGSR
jgi:4-carboxymuconolactone decarboxylase